MIPKTMCEYSLKDGSYLRKCGSQEEGVVFSEIDFAVEVSSSLKLLE